MKLQYKPASSNDEGRAGHLSGGFEKGPNVGRQRVGDKSHRVDPMIGGEELYTVPRRGLDQRRYRVLLRTPPTQGHSMQDRVGRKAQSPGLVLGSCTGSAEVTLASGEECQEEKERKEASSLPGRRPPNL